jgi:hypothetical protein
VARRSLSIHLLHDSNDCVGRFQLHVVGTVCLFQRRTARKVKYFGPHRFALFCVLVHVTICFECLR